MPNQVTAIVPTFNRARYISDCVEGLMRQTRSVEQIIIWDDGSTDSTKDVLHDLTQRHGNQLQVFHAPNGGKSHALNQAIRHATGDYIWICDDDDIACPEAAMRLAVPLDEGRADLSAGRHVRFYDDLATGDAVLMDTGYWPDLSSGSVLRHMLEDIFFFQNASLVRQDSLISVGGYDETLARSVDYDMLIRLALRHPIEMVDGIMFHQRKHDGARGPASARHNATQSEGVWAAADQRIFKKLRDTVPLDLYRALFDSEDSELLSRAALLQRACTYARKLDWETAIIDLNAAATLKPDVPLTNEERNIVRRTMAAKHGCASAFRKPVSSALIKLGKSSFAGASIVNAMARGSLWRLREATRNRDFAGASAILKFVAATLNTPRDVCASQLTERRSLPPEAYLK